MLKLLSVIILFTILFTTPIPTECNSSSHFPTIPNTYVCQSFGHLEHVGVDFKVPVGSEVYAAMDGVVIRTENNGRVYGRYLILLHCDGYLSLYAHLSEFKVKFGDIVYSGELIALSGGDPDDAIDGDGWSTGEHLHFEIRVPGHWDNNQYNIDPLVYLESMFIPNPLKYIAE